MGTVDGSKSEQWTVFEYPTEKKKKIGGVIISSIEMGKNV